MTLVKASAGAVAMAAMLGAAMLGLAGPAAAAPEVWLAAKA